MVNALLLRVTFRVILGNEMTCPDVAQDVQWRRVSDIPHGAGNLAVSLRR